MSLPARKKSGRKLQAVTRVLARLDEMTREIPPPKRRALLAELMQQALRIDVGDGERVRKRLYDFRHKPGRSHKR